MFGYAAYEVWADFRRLLTRCTRPERPGRRRSFPAEGDSTGPCTASGNGGGKNSQPSS
ncbi:hypothetical protein BX281_0034 [Streptomyces sp. Ag82_O1-15]|nr:hypothetical protein BX281_0034 [Streptomyces sp. Ag82_O1-15]